MRSEMDLKPTRLKDYALVIVPPPPPRFTQTEWNLNNTFRTRTCQSQQQLADSVIADVDRAIDEVIETTDLNKRETDHKLQEKIKDIEFNQNEIQKQRKEVVIEIDNLSTYIQRLEDCLKALREDALKICRKCLILREGRLGIDLCTDETDVELHKELQVIEGVQSLMTKTLEEANDQVRRLRSTIYFMDRDLEDKGNVLKIDSHNCSLKETSLNLSLYNGSTPLNNANITLEEWNNFTKANIEKAAKEINSARLLRTYVDTLLKQGIEDLWHQYHTVNNALRRRIEVLKDCKMKMEIQHSEVSRQVNEMTRAITRLEIALSKEEGYMALAHTRLGNRAQRPGMELCKDLVEMSLVREVAELRGNCSVLQQKLAEAQASLRYLLKVQIQLEEDINVKTATLKIDEVDCMTLRQSMDYHSY